MFLHPCLSHSALFSNSFPWSIIFKIYFLFIPPQPYLFYVSVSFSDPYPLKKCLACNYLFSDQMGIVTGWCCDEFFNILHFLLLTSFVLPCSVREYRRSQTSRRSFSDYWFSCAFQRFISCTNNCFLFNGRLGENITKQYNGGSQGLM